MILPLEIAGVRLDLALPGEAPAALDRLLPFARGAGPARWRVAVARAPGPPLPPEVEGRCDLGAGGRWVVPGAEEAGWLDPATGAGEVSLDPALLALDTFLRAAVAAEVLERGGLLLHGAAVAVDGGAFLCPARSGAGKSALAARAGHPLSDEVSALLPAGGGFAAHATPWWRSRGGSAPLAAVCELARDGEALAPLPGTPLRLLAANLVLPLDQPAARARALEVAAAVARSVPLARLAFRLDSDVDRILRHPARPLPPVGRGPGPW